LVFLRATEKWKYVTREVEVGRGGE